MLNAETKRHIDAARQVLVGVVPNPTTQIDQITNALIYKFMDDMDQAAVKAGGNPSFFVGDLKRHAWSRLMDPRVGNQERMNLYAEALQKFAGAKSLPELFRDIFKSAFLPYRSPETLGLFLREIAYFDYAHSEELGNAYEYLLSIMSSQGDAGQFRTPRHIIDFIVDVVNPTKDETVLDPACGTAGFLISAYRHILEQHDGKNDPEKKEKPLTPDQRRKLVSNFEGYDIDPGMIRLAQVNMYLHQFKSPKIFSYDTLTQDERWNDKFDVILANPPFMSPKGGIKPHSRFSIQAKRSEVLFVDYIAEHLKLSGRAGIIVPEGVIFQSQTAYKELRKLLVENSLVAVVSLPAGCFNPYSGVKTSILLLDKSLARQSDTIAFFKVENDGFGLGAQRRAIEKNDLPQVRSELDAYFKTLPSKMPTDTLALATGLIVPKEKIAANGDYNLNGDRYREGEVQSTSFPWRTVGSLVETVTPPAKIQKTAFAATGRFPVIDQSQDAIAGWTNDESSVVYPTKPLVIFGDHTCAIKLAETPFAQGADGIKILQTVEELDPRFLFLALRARPLESAGYQRHYSKLKDYQIPLPPLRVQKEIVAEIENYQKIIDGARAVLDNYRPHISIDPDWPMVELGEACEINPESVNPSVEFPNETIFYADIASVKNETGEFLGYTEVSSAESPSRARRRIRRGDVLLSTVRPNLKAFTIMRSVCERAIASTGFAVLRAKKWVVDPEFLLVSVASDQAVEQMIGMSGRGAYPSINQSDVAIIKIPLPTLATQQSIVAEIEAERALVAANRELITRFEQKIQSVLACVWGEDATSVGVAE